MTLKELFLKEVMKYGTATPETVRRLADEMKSRKNAGRPKKTKRNFALLAWYYVATRYEGWKSGTAFAEMADRVGIEDRNARKAFQLAKKQHFMTYIYRVEYDSGAVLYLSYVLTKDVFSQCWVSVKDYAPDDMRLEGLVDGKNVHFFCFDKSTF